MRLAFRLVLAAACALVALPAIAAPVKITEVEPAAFQAAVRTKVGEYLKRADAKLAIEALEDKIKLDSEQIAYSGTKGTVGVLEWKYAVLAGWTDAMAPKVAILLTDILKNVFGNYGMLLSDDDATAVFKLAKYTPDSMIAPPPPPPPTPPPPPDQDTTVKGYVWIVAGGCGCGVPMVPTCGVVYRPAHLTGGCGGCGSAIFAATPSSGLVASATAATTVAWTARKAPDLTGVTDPQDLFGMAFDAFWERDLSTAQTALNRAIDREPLDSRVWYFKALTERALGNDPAANDAASRAAALEFLEPSRTAAWTYLDRVQGESRRFLRAAAAEIANEDSARKIAYAPVKPTARAVAAK